MIAKHRYARWPLTLAAAGTTAMVVALCSEAHADRLTIRNPGQHPRYSFELEPHLLLGVFGAPGPLDDNGFGIGVRGTVPIVDNGFVKTINNSVGIGFGLDWIHHDGGYYYRYDRRDSRDRYWVDDADVFRLPVVLQWNFWLSENWSVFGEPGVAIVIWDDYRRDYVDDTHVDFDPFVLFAGGRWHFADFASLTMRIGYPTFSVGVSFLL